MATSTQENIDAPPVPCLQPHEAYKARASKQVIPRARATLFNGQVNAPKLSSVPWFESWWHKSKMTMITPQFQSKIRCRSAGSPCDVYKHGLKLAHPFHSLIQVGDTWNISSVRTTRLDPFVRGKISKSMLLCPSECIFSASRFVKKNGNPPDAVLGGKYSKLKNGCPFCCWIRSMIFMFSEYKRDDLDHCLWADLDSETDKTQTWKRLFFAIFGGFVQVRCSCHPRIPSTLLSFFCFYMHSLEISCKFE
jgi:hypothetical protein